MPTRLGRCMSRLVSRPAGPGTNSGVTESADYSDYTDGIKICGNLCHLWIVMDEGGLAETAADASARRPYQRRFSVYPANFKPLCNSPVAHKAFKNVGSDKIAVFQDTNLSCRFLQSHTKARRGMED